MLWLTATELRRAGLRSGLTALALAVAILTVSVLDQQTETRQNMLLRDYEAAGAATFVAELRTADDEIEVLVRAVRRLRGIKATEAPYRGSDLRLTADTSFLVFQNEKQQEYLGATTTVLGVSDSFDLAGDYYGTIGRESDDTVGTPLGIPLVVTDGVARPPTRNEVLIPATVAEYVGVRAGAVATIELRSKTDQGQTAVHRYSGLTVIGVFDATGPDEGRFAPFWRLSARGRDVLTVRRPDAANEIKTTLPIVLNAALMRDLLNEQQHKLWASGIDDAEVVGRQQLVMRASTAYDIPLAQQAVKRLLIYRGLSENCLARHAGSFCIALPERNNFDAALHEQAKFGRGVGFFTALLLALIAIGNAGLQLQTVINRRHDHAVMQALGFTPVQLLLCSILRLCMVFGSGIAAAALLWVMMPSPLDGSFRAFATAAALCSATSLITAVAALLWPLRSHPGAQIRELT
jgi:hypothetical protein